MACWRGAAVCGCGMAWRWRWRMAWRAHAWRFARCFAWHRGMRACWRVTRARIRRTAPQRCARMYALRGVAWRVGAALHILRWLARAWRMRACALLRDAMLRALRFALRRWLRARRAYAAPFLGSCISILACVLPPLRICCLVATDIAAGAPFVTTRAATPRWLYAAACARSILLARAGHAAARPFAQTYRARTILVPQHNALSFARTCRQQQRRVVAGAARARGARRRRRACLARACRASRRACAAARIVACARAARAKPPPPPHLSYPWLKTSFKTTCIACAVAATPRA